METGQDTGSANNQPGNVQNIAGPVRGNRPQGMGRGNGTEFRNRTLFDPDNGNLTAPLEKPDLDFYNTTALNRTARHGPWAGNMSAVNMTDIPPPDWDPANMTALNHTAWHGDGNLTPPEQPQQGRGNNRGPQGNSDQQMVQDQKNSGDSLITELISWLKAHGIS